MRRRQPRVSEVRRSIRSAVAENPGIHFRGLSRAAGVTSAGQLRHHLDKLERDGDVVEVEDGRYRRFFVAGQHDAKVRGEMARFAREVPRRIARLLLESPMNRTQLRRSLRCADSTLGYHLSRMVMLGDLARLRGPQSCVYSLTREDDVRRMLLAQGPADDGSADPAAGSWENGPPDGSRLGPDMEPMGGTGRLDPMDRLDRMDGLSTDGLRSTPEAPVDTGGLGRPDGQGRFGPEPAEPFGRFAETQPQPQQADGDGEDDARGDDGNGGAGRGPLQE